MNSCRCDRLAEPEHTHRVFWEHLRAGGVVWRNDPLNGVQELLTKEKVIEEKGCVCKIGHYGYNDLSCIGKPERTVHKWV